MFTDSLNRKTTILDKDKDTKKTKKSPYKKSM